MSQDYYKIVVSPENKISDLSVVYYSGILELSPQSDVWIDQKRITALNPEFNDLYDKTVKDLGVNTQTGFAPTEWGSWETYHSSSVKSDPVTIPGTTKTTTNTTRWANGWQSYDVAVAATAGLPNNTFVADVGLSGSTVTNKTTASTSTTITTTSESTLEISTKFAKEFIE